MNRIPNSNNLCKLEVAFTGIEYLVGIKMGAPIWEAIKQYNLQLLNTKYQMPKPTTSSNIHKH